MNFYITKQIINLIITFYSLYELNYGYKYLPKVLLLYFSIDIYFQEKREGVIHHIISLFLSYFFYISLLNETINDLKNIIDLGIIMEYSNIFLFLKNILDKIDVENMSELTKIKHKAFKTITELGFIFCFVRYRLIENYLFLFKNNFEILCNAFDLDAYIIYFIVISLKLLNIYWFIIILKKIYKKLFINSYINTELYSEYTEKYISLLFPIYIFTKNMFLYKWYYYFDTLGVLIFSLNKFLFHNYNIKSIIYPNNYLLIENWLNYYVFSIHAFNIKTFFNSFTICIYLNNNLYYIFFCFLLFVHTQIFLHYKLIKSQHSDLKLTNYFSMYETKNNIYYWMCVNHFWFIFNNLITSLFLNNDEHFIHNFIVLYITLIVMIVKPFYKQNNTLLLTLLFIQNIISTNSYR